MTTRGQFDDRIKRIVPRRQREVNGHWICDEGRLSYQRLEAAAAAGDGPRRRRARRPDWDEAVRSGRRAAQGGGGERAAPGAIVSPRLTSRVDVRLEGAARRAGPACGSACAASSRGEDDDLLIRADKGANSSGAAWIFGDRRGGRGGARGGVGAGEIDTLLVLGDPLDPEDTATVGESVRAKLTDLIYVGPFLDGAAQAATVLLPVAAWAEEDGTLRQLRGPVQWVAALPPAARRGAARLARGRRPGRGRWGSSCRPGARPATCWRRWPEASRPFEGLTEEKIGLLGVRGAAAPAGA